MSWVQWYHKYVRVLLDSCRTFMMQHHERQDMSKPGFLNNILYIKHKGEGMEITTPFDLWNINKSVFCESAMVAMTSDTCLDIEIKTLWKCSWDMPYTCCFHKLPKLIYRSSGKCIQGQSFANHLSHLFDRQQIRSTRGPRHQFNMIGNEKMLNNVCHVQSCIVVIKLRCRQALYLMADNRIPNFRDVAVAVECTSSAY